MARGSHNPHKIMENATPFDLTAAIQQWRDNLVASHACTPDDLDQLESHLRDSAATLQTRGLSLPEAFWVAKSRLGTNEELSCEFAKVNAGQIWLERVLWFLIGSVFLKAINALASGLSNAAAMVLYAFTKSDRLLGPFTSILFAGLSVGLLWLVWRSGLDRHGAISRVVAWMKRHPIQAAIGWFMVSPITVAMNVLTVKTMPLSAYATVTWWRSLGSMVPLIVFPIVFGWLLVRTRPKTAIAERS